MKLGDLQKASDLSLSEMLEKAKELLHPQMYTKEEICSILKWDEGE